MNHSDYLKWKLDGERHLAMSLEGGVRNLPHQIEKSLYTMYSGIERASWYLSCLVKGYQSVCKELIHEDYRMLLAINELDTRSYAILDMIVMYINSTVDEGWESTSNLGRKTLIGSIDLQKSMRVTAAVNLTIAYTLAKAIAKKSSHSLLIRKKINHFVFSFMTVAGIYGHVQHAAKAANKLKVKNRDFYDMLYSNDLEMLYFIVEPVIAPADDKLLKAKARGDVIPMSQLKEAFGL